MRFPNYQTKHSLIQDHTIIVSKKNKFIKKFLVNLIQYLIVNKNNLRSLYISMDESTSKF